MNTARRSVYGPTPDKNQCEYINTRPRNWKALFQTKKHSTKRNSCGKTNFHFIFQNHFTLNKLGGFLDFTGAWPKILIKCVRVGQKIRVGRETLNRQFFWLKTVLTLLKLLSLFILSSLVFKYFYVECVHRLLFLIHLVCQSLFYRYGYFVGEKKLCARTDYYSFEKSYSHTNTQNSTLYLWTSM